MQIKKIKFNKISKLTYIKKKWLIIVLASLLIISLFVFFLFSTHGKSSRLNVTKEILKNAKAQSKTKTFEKILKNATQSSDLVKILPIKEPVMNNQNLGYCLSVPVLMYHHVEPWSQAIALGQTSLSVDSNIFNEQMQYLVSHGYNTIFADDLVNALINKTTLPSKTIVVTIDDGYKDIYDYAFPVAQKYNIKLNVMIPTGLLGVASGTNTYFTWNELSNMVSSGLVRAYNHTWSHFPLASGDEQKDQFEIMTAQTQLSQHLGSLPTILTYPYGSGVDSPFVHSLLQKDGIVAAFSTLPGVYQCTSYIYGLRRTRIGSTPFPAYGIN